MLLVKQSASGVRNEVGQENPENPRKNLVMGCSCASRCRRGKLSTRVLMAGPAAGCRRIAPISLDSMSYATEAQIIH